MAERCALLIGVEGRVAQRPQDWEKRLACEITAARRRCFHARDWNCARFAHSCAQSVSGRDIAFAWKGSLAESVDAVLPRVDVALAHRGDVVLASVPEPSLGVCIGARAAFVTKQGLLTRRMADCSIAWSV